MRQLVLLLALIWALPLSAAPVGEAKKGVELPEDISQLLKQEMQQIRLGMESLTWLVASGDFEAVAKVGHALKSGYVMKRELSKEQRHTLMAVLPKGFKMLDQRFHQHAGMLAAAAKKRNTELVNFYIYKMNEGCVACHSRFVANRFEGFSKPLKKEHHH